MDSLDWSFKPCDETENTSLLDFLRRYVLIVKAGLSVYDTHHTCNRLALEDFRTYQLNNRMGVIDTRIETEPEYPEIQWVPIAEMWLRDIHRKTAYTTPFCQQTKEHFKKIDQKLEGRIFHD